MSAPIEGVDVSGWQPDPGRKGAPEWDFAVRDGLRFVIIKTSEGIGGDSDAWEQYADAARAAGLVVGAYHFVRWDTPKHTAQAQLDWMAACGGGPRLGDLRPTIDLETGGVVDRDVWPRKRRAAFVVELVELVVRRYDCTPIVYCGAGFAASELGMAASEALERCAWMRPSYLARGTGAPPTKGPPHYGSGPLGSRSPQIWQWAGGKGRVPWMAGAVDRDVILGGESALEGLVQR